MENTKKKFILNLCAVIQSLLDQEIKNFKNITMKTWGKTCM
jgi:hypothetical protein